MDTPLIVELIPDPELGGFTARIPDIPAYGEGETEDEAIVDLKEALRAYIEAFGIDDAVGSKYSYSGIEEPNEPAMGTNGPRPHGLPRALVWKAIARSAPDGPRPPRIPHG